MNFILKPGTLTLDDIKILLDEDTNLILDESCYEKIYASEELVSKIVLENKTVYGINTGFGLLVNTKIANDDLETLQRNLVLSHATGTGDLLSNEVVRLILLLKINSLARGYSGIRLQTIDALIQFFNHKIYPCIPSQGSVGASGDLAPLAHLSSAILGVGDVWYEGEIIAAKDALNKIELTPITLIAKEGLALLNGTQVSTALGLIALIRTENIFSHAVIAGALSIDATLSTSHPFDERIHEVRGLQGQIKVAKMLRDLLNESEMNHSHVNCGKVQDPYSLRCQPQVMGACLENILYAKNIFLIEANAVTDNPLVFAEDDVIISGGNFHAEPIAIAADALALSIAEIGALSERRIALLVDPKFSSLPPFLVKNAGINSGFMIAQVTAAALASENKSLAHPASVDSIPTSANQEDHVSMATYAARRLLQMLDNTQGIIAIELLAAAQGIDFRRPLKTSEMLEKVHAQIRNEVTFYESDRYFAPDILKIKKLISKEILKSDYNS